MLILSRREQQTIIINNDIVVTVERICGDRVRISIDAPSDVHIRRGELEPLIEHNQCPG